MCICSGTVPPSYKSVVLAQAASYHPESILTSNNPIKVGPTSNNLQTEEDYYNVGAE